MATEEPRTMENPPPNNPPKRGHRRDLSYGQIHQPTIRTFFQPRPQYTPAPGSASSTPLSPSQTIPEVVTKPTPPKPTSNIPPQASIVPIQSSHISPLRRINSLLLPINYPDAFYNHILIPPPGLSPTLIFSRSILWSTPSPLPTTPSACPAPETKLIGSLICRLDLALSADSTPTSPLYEHSTYDIYIQSLSLLSPYRGKGLAAAALQQIIDAATTQTEIKINSLYAHVWTENEEALNWYKARGFVREEPILHGYYRRLKPDTAWILRRRLLPSDMLQSPLQNPASAHPSHPPPVPFSFNFPAAPPPTPITPLNSTPSKSLPPSTTSTPPPSALGGARPTQPPHARSFQNLGPEREWNDLPENILKPSSRGVSESRERGKEKDMSEASSRSSSRSGISGIVIGEGTESGRESGREGRSGRERSETIGGKRKKRVYPAAAFGV